MAKVKYILTTLFIIVISQVFSHAQAPGESPLERHFNILSESDALKHGSWCFMVYDTSADTLIMSHNSRQRMVPASTQKLITTASALLMLGHDYQYNTMLQHDGEVDEAGTLHGNLYIKGSGDPAFGSSHMHDTLSLDTVYARWKNMLDETGIQRINGHIIADGRVFDDEMVPPRWLWGHIGNYFGAGSTGLTVNENKYTVYFDAGKALAEPATVSHTKPLIPGMSFINEVTTGPAGSGDQVYIFGVPYSSERRLTGTVPLGSVNFPVRGSMPDPAYYASQRLKDYFMAEGIEVSGEATTHRRATRDGVIPFEDRETIATWHAPGMFDIIYRTNLASVNTYAENLLKTIGAETKNEGSRTAGLKAIAEYWDAYDMDPALESLHDGSGLATSNRVTAEQLMTVMIAAANHPTFQILYNSLPLAGYSGSLANHLRGSKSEGVLRAKSGFLNNVISYAGFTPMQNGNLAAFVIIVNDYDGNAGAMRNNLMHLMNSVTLHDGSVLE